MYLCVYRLIKIAQSAVSLLAVILTTALRKLNNLSVPSNDLKEVKTLVCSTLLHCFPVFFR